MCEFVPFNILLNEVLTSVTKDKEEIFIETESGKKFVMCHSQDCCENVDIHEITGEASSVIGLPIIKAEELQSQEHVEEVDESADSFTWTYYELATTRGRYVVKWFGSSNGYYSETPGLYQIG